MARKQIALLFLGLFVGAMTANALTEKPSTPDFDETAETSEPVILGHRIGPQGQEMFVYAK